jgi:hypothetical protein
LEKVKKYGNAVSELAKQIENEMELSTISSANAHKPTK